MKRKANHLEFGNSICNSWEKNSKSQRQLTNSKKNTSHIKGCGMLSKTTLRRKFKKLKCFYYYIKKKKQNKLTEHLNKRREERKKTNKKNPKQTKTTGRRNYPQITDLRNDQ